MAVMKEYLDYQDEMEKKYGDKTIVLMEVGDFIELYGIETDTIKKGRISEINAITGWAIATKKGRIPEYDVYNTLMMGFPNRALDKWKELLINHGYTAVVILQDSHGTKAPKRYIHEIVSPGINIDTNRFSNNFISVYLEELKDYKSKQPILSLGLAIVDISTGQTTVYETFSKPNDYNYALDEIFRFIQSHRPKEIIFHCQNVSLNREDIKSYLEINHIKIHFNFYEDKPELKKTIFKEELLRKIYVIEGNITAIEYIGLEKNQAALDAFIYLLQFTYEHNENIINRLRLPKFWATSKYLILSHDSINQLNVISQDNVGYQSGIKSLWDILDKTVTCLGKRHLKYKLLNPILNISELNNIYSSVEFMQEKHIYKDHETRLYEIIRTMLQPVCDIERIHRKMAVQIMQPQDFTTLDMSYKSIIQLIDYFKLFKNNYISDIRPSEDVLSKFNEFIDDYRSKIKMDKIVGLNQSDIIESFFEKGYFAEIDEVQEKIEHYKEYFNVLQNKLVELLPTTGNKTPIELKNNDTDGYYFHTSISRANTLRKTFTKKTEITFTVNNTTHTVKTCDLIMKNNASSCKIKSGETKQKSHLWRGYQENMKNLCKKQLSVLLHTYYTKYHSILLNICEFVANIDYLACISKVSIENGYVRPEIDNNSNCSYIDATDVRHPIIEKIKDNVKYVSNDVVLGNNEQKGILLYGVNAVGKSSYMKSIGLCIIMAQSGFFVPAKRFKYAIYTNLFTRISSNDNIFKGQSSFAVEMSELRSIFSRTDKNSLVLGDELCSGTETTSALAIVTAGVEWLSKKQSSFVFATHLHKLSEMPEIKEAGNVKEYHMETIYNEETKRLIYNRKLKSGSGSSIYGLEVAKAMNLDPLFIKKANTIRKRITSISNNLVENKTSNFNSKLIISNCSICKNPTEDVHHISEQHLANSDGMIEQFHKNNLFNLVQLCKQCHYEVHHGKLVINGYVDTLDGIQLDYKYITINSNTSGEEKKKKYSQDTIDIIKDIYSKTNKYSTTKNQLFLDYNINISTPTIKKMIENKY